MTKTPEKFRAAVVGATGYTGQEVVRLLVSHPRVSVSVLTSRGNLGRAYEELFPGFRGFNLPPISRYQPEKLSQKADIVFFCLPHGESQSPVAAAVKQGVKVIDMSADFRLRRASVYERWYGKHRHPELLKSSVYGLAEVYRERIKRSVLVANPGCYPTAVILGMAPFLRAGVVELGRPLIADMKSGVSGAGRKAELSLSFCEVNEALRPYSLYRHRHTPEMEQELSKAAGRKVRLTFTPHLVPANRGILGTLYLPLKKKMRESALRQILERAYQDEPFVRVLPRGELPCLSRVRGTNFIDLAVSVSPEGREIIVTAALDNLMKGAAGAAVQNMNLMLGLPETAGLLAAPLRP